MNDMQSNVRTFHQAFGAPAPDAPQMLPEGRKQLRIALIAEELQELEEALEDDDIIETYDAAIDLLVVTFGLLVEMGLDAEPGFLEVHASNMSKLGADGQPILSRGEELDGYPAGKILKGPTYFRPRLATVLAAMGAKF
jgi:predicted HAD superfamily Cof-like phosphohydrolase